eukprot:4304936-Karenia_brevis.AAC.1
MVFQRMLAWMSDVLAFVETSMRLGAIRPGATLALKLASVGHQSCGMVFRAMLAWMSDVLTLAAGYLCLGAGGPGHLPSHSNLWACTQLSAWVPEVLASCPCVRA